MTFNVTFTKEELPQLRKVLDRAMNTWEPQDQPAWLQDLSDRLDRSMNLHTAVITADSPSKFGSVDMQALILENIKAQHRAMGLLHRGGVL